MGYAKDYLKAYVVTGGKGGASALYAIEQAKQRKKLEELQKQQQPQPVRKYSKGAEETAWIGVVAGLATPVIIGFILYRLIFC